jgi:hypothetical protein
MELNNLKSKTIGEFADELGEVLTTKDYDVIAELEVRTRQSLLGVDEKLAVSALLMAIINTVCEHVPALQELTTT